MLVVVEKGEQNKRIGEMEWKTGGFPWRGEGVR